MAFDLASAKDVPESKPGFDLASAKDVPTVSQTEAALRSLISGATFGLAPRASAAISTGLGKIMPETFGTEGYDQRLREYLEADRAAKEQHPKTSIAGSIVGGLPSAIATGGAGLARMVGGNAAIAAAQSAGSEPELLSKDTAINAAQSAALGGGLSMLPTAAIKGVDVAQNYTKKKIAENLQNVLNQKGTMPTKDWHTQVRKATGTPEGISLRDSFRDVPTALKEKIGTVKSAPNLSEIKADFPGASNAPLSDFSKEARAMASYTPGVKEALWKTTKDAAVTGGVAAGVNELFGEKSPLDTWEAVAGGAALGALGRGSGFGLMDALSENAGALAKGAVTRIGTSPIPENILWKSLQNPNTTSAIQNTLIQTAASEPQENSFRKLTEWLNQIPEEERRKKAMELQSTAEGRAQMNSDSPLNK